MTPTIAFTSLSPADHAEVAALLHESLVDWYERRLGQGARFGDSPEPFRLFPEVYEALDPGEAVTARDPSSGRLLGICFSHERESHISVGIVSTSPAAAGQGLAKKMVSLVLEKARRVGKPTRLVSSLLNLDSFSLYTRLGFVPGQIFQDLLITVPEVGMPLPAAEADAKIREASAADVPLIADLEESLMGIRRDKDFAFFLRNDVGSWRVLVAEKAGKVIGFLVVSTLPSFQMVGPGACMDEATAAALLWRALDSQRGKTMVFLVPCAAAELVRTAYAWGARNVELHVAQSTAPRSTVCKGVSFPTFLPESA